MTPILLFLFQPKIEEAELFPSFGKEEPTYRSYRSCQFSVYFHFESSFLPMYPFCLKNSSTQAIWDLE